VGVKVGLGVLVGVGVAVSGPMPIRGASEEANMNGARTQANMLIMIKTAITIATAITTGLLLMISKLVSSFPSYKR